MKEFKRVSQNDLLLEFLNYVNENIWVDITRVEVEKYIDDDVLTFYKSKSMFVKLNDVEYYVNLFYNDLENETTLAIYEIIPNEDNEDILCEIEKLVRKRKKVNKGGKISLTYGIIKYKEKERENYVN